MGRRFQTYYIYNGEEGLKQAGFHIQVCCGDDTLCLLEQSLLFAEKYSEYPLNLFLKPKYDFSNQSVSLLSSLTNIIYRTGIFLNSRKLGEHHTDPLIADNDEGIFIIDLSNPKPKYLLFDYNFKVVTPEEYFNIYKEEYSEEDDIIKDIPDIIQNIYNFDTIDLNDLKEIYPNLYNKNI